MDEDPGRHPGEKVEEDKSSCNDCCERVAWSSIVAAVVTVIGAILVVVCVGFSSRTAGPLFSNTYIEAAVYTWFSWISIGAYIGLVIMIAMVVLLFSVGCMATGYQNASTWCAFNKAQTGRRQLTAFMILTYVINLGWYVFLFGSTMPTVFFMMLQNGVCTNTVYTASTCLDLRQFGLAPQSLLAAVNSTLICEQNLQAICESSLRSNFITGLIGCVLVLIGMNHFMMSISGNYNWLRLRKRRQKLMASQINRRSGTYDLSVSPYTQRQESRDSNAHLRRVNLHHGSSSNILTSSNTSIPTVAAHVPPPVITTSSTFSMPVTSSSSKTEPASNSSSMQSSKIFNQTYGFDDGGFSQHNGGGTRVTFADTKKHSTAFADPKNPSAAFADTKAHSAAFADTKTTSAAAPRSNTTSAAPKRTTVDDKNDLSKYADRSFDSANRYDHFNPAFDENYWDQQQHAPPLEQTKSDNYYSKGYNNAPKTNGTATSYDQGNYNQGYYNYDYDAADAGKYQANATSSYGQDKSQSYAQDKSQSYGQDKSQSYAQDKSWSYAQDKSPSYAQDKSQSYTQDKSQSYAQDKSQSYAQDKSQPYAQETSLSYAPDKSQSYAQDKSQSYAQDKSQSHVPSSQSHVPSSQSLEKDRKAMGNNFYEYQL